MLPSSIAAVFLLPLFSCSWSSAAAESCSEKYEPPLGFQGYIYSTLNEAVEAGDYGCVKELLENGDSPDSWDSTFNTPLRSAAQRDYGDIAKLLLSHGAQPNDKTAPGDVPIMDAVCHGSTKVIKVLVDAGASTDIVQYDQRTPSQTACTCSVSPPGCPMSEIKEMLDKPTLAVYFNHEFASNDGVMNDGTKDITANNRECHELCADTSGCSVWTRIKRTVSGVSKEGECWLRSYQPEAAKCDHCDSGVMSCEVFAKTGYTTSVDRIGYEFSNGITKSNHDCCALCYGTPHCKSWTRIRWNTKYNKKGECWLRSGYSQGHHNRAAASGQIKRGTHNEPEPTGLIGTLSQVLLD